MKEATQTTLEQKAMEALRQLEPHSPSWVKIIRRYIRSLKKDADELEDFLDIVTAEKEKYIPGDHGDYD